jgi:hypothetical protein
MSTITFTDEYGHQRSFPVSRDVANAVYFLVLAVPEPEPAEKPKPTHLQWRISEWDRRIH